MPSARQPAAGSRLQASIDNQCRLVLVPSKYERDDIFRDRPSVQGSMSLADMENAIAAAVGREDHYTNVVVFFCCPQLDPAGPDRPSALTARLHPMAQGDPGGGAGL